MQPVPAATALVRRHTHVSVVQNVQRQHSMLPVIKTQVYEHCTVVKGATIN